MEVLSLLQIENTELQPGDILTAVIIQIVLVDCVDAASVAAGNQFLKGIIVFVYLFLAHARDLTLSRQVLVGFHDGHREQLKDRHALF